MPLLPIAAILATGSALVYRRATAKGHDPFIALAIFTTPLLVAPWLGWW